MLTPWNGTLLVTQLVKKLPAFYGTRRLLTVKMAVFWDVTPCSLVEVYRRFRGLIASIISAMSKPRARNWFEILEPIGPCPGKFRPMPVSSRGLLVVLMMEAACTSETSVNFYQTTRRNNPEDSYLLR
jgi:hypothetical protein